MKRLSLIVAASLLLAADNPKSASVKKDPEKLQGTWKLVSLEVNGEQIALKSLERSRLVVTGEKYHFQLDKMALDLTFQMDPAKKPKAIDLKIVSGPYKGKVYHGIYTLEGDTFKICRHSEPDKDRPTAFVTKENSGLMMVVWKRQKP
jgi:uncharacterized protein (TIGR03067 family)